MGSSTDVEDGMADSFAGTYETILDVPVSKIPEAVETVASSVRNEHAGVYTNVKNVQSKKIALNIQRYIPAEFAGVLFCIIPCIHNIVILTNLF